MKIKKRYIFFILIAIVWYVFSGVFFSSRDSLLEWAAVLFVYSGAGYYVCCGVFSITMAAPVTGARLEPGHDDFLRAVCFIPSLVLMLASSLG